MFSFLNPITRTNKTTSMFRNPFRRNKNSVKYFANSKNVQQANTKQEEAKAKVEAEIKALTKESDEIAQIISGSRTKLRKRRNEQVADMTQNEKDILEADLEAKLDALMRIQDLDPYENPDVSPVLDEYIRFHSTKGKDIPLSKEEEELLNEELARYRQVLGGTRKRRKNKKHKKHKKKLLSFKRSHIKY